jgi:pilus assembly protein FimV
MIRKLWLGISALALLMPGVASALGIGSYQLHSYLNQPLSMDITLNGAEDLASSDIIVSLATQQEFDNAGVNFASDLSGISFKVTLDGNGGGVIHVSTKDPVNEPYMDFLVQILWPTGRILREYTILLDPPSYTSTNAPVVMAPATSNTTQPQNQAPATQPAQVTTQPTPVTVNAGSTSTNESATTQAAAQQVSTAETYTVRKGDTLWQIASHYRAGPSVSVQQMIMAIEKANPDAFYVKGNANFVNAGAVLRIPSETTVRQYDTRSAMDKLASQNRHWRAILTARGIPVPSGNQINGGSNQVERQPEGGAGTAHGEVKLLAATGKGGSAEGAASGSEQALSHQLAIKAENVDRLTQENQDLSSRITDLKQQINTSDKLLKLRNDQIAAMQAKLRELQKKGVKIDASLLKPVASASEVAKAAETAGSAQKSEEVKTTPAPATVTAGNQAAAGTAQQPNATPNVAETGKAGAAAGAAKPAPVKPRVAPNPQPEGLVASVIQYINQNLMVVGGVLILIILIIAALVMRSRKQAEETDDTFEGGDYASDGGDDDFISGGLMADDDRRGALDEDQDMAGTDEDASATGTAGSDQEPSQDPLAELDVYIAYGRFPQAIDFLRNEIKRAPERADLKVRLLEVEKEAGDESAFAKDAAQFGGDNGDIDACITRLGGAVSGARAEPTLDDLEMDLSTSKPLTGSGGQDVDDFGDFQLGDTGSMDGDIKPGKIDKPLEFPSDEKGDGQPEETFEMDDAFTLDEGDLPEQFQEKGQENELSEADVSAMDNEEQGLDLSDEFSLEGDESSSSNLELADNGQKEATNELSLEDLEAAAASDTELEVDDLNLDEVEDDVAEEVTAKPVSGRRVLDEDDSAGDTAINEALIETAPKPAASGSSASTAVDDLDLGDDNDFDFLGDTDENATKLDLARAYIDMGDHEGARDILNEVVSEGNDQQQSEARELLSQVG